MKQHRASCVSRFQINVGCLAGVWLVIAAMATGQSADTAGDADAHCRSAWGLLQLAEVSNSPPQDTKSNLGKAMEECDAALKIRPDFFRASALAAHCSYRLAQLEGDPHLHDEGIRAARVRFEAAAHCTGAEASLFREWGGMLTFESGLQKDARSRLALLREARQVYESGIRAANY